MKHIHFLNRDWKKQQPSTKLIVARQKICVRPESLKLPSFNLLSKQEAPVDGPPHSLSIHNSP